MNQHHDRLLQEWFARSDLHVNCTRQYTPSDDGNYNNNEIDPEKMTIALSDQHVSKRHCALLHESQKTKKTKLEGVAGDIQPPVQSELRI